MQDKIKVKSYGKVNLGLDVIGKRKDGFHEVDLIMHEIKLCDTILMKKIRKKQIIIRCSLPYVPSDERNIAYKACEAFLKKNMIDQGVFISIHKKIPVCAGLGGGSANAASVIKALNKMFDTRMSKEEMAMLCEELGSDVPFFVYGKTMRAHGRGEILENINVKRKFVFLLVNPRINCQTKTIYQNFDANAVNHPSIDNIIKLLESDNYKHIEKGTFGNVLENPAFMLYEELPKLKQKLMQTNARDVFLTGSGSTIVGVYDNKYDAIKASEKFKYKGIRTIVTESL